MVTTQPGSTSTYQSDSKDRIVALLDELPASVLAEVVSFVEYQRYKLSLAATQKPVPVKLGGLMAGVTVSDADIADVRSEMWGAIEDRVP